MPKKKIRKCRRAPIAKPAPPPLLGPKDQADRYRANARYRSGTLIEQLWREMLKLESFTVRQLAALEIVSKNYCKIYVRILFDAGYLKLHPSFRTYGRSPHNPARYLVGEHYRGSMAPQMAGGAGSGGHLSNGWKSLEKKA